MVFIDWFSFHFFNTTQIVFNWFIHLEHSLYTIALINWIEFGNECFCKKFYLHYPDHPDSYFLVLVSDCSRDYKWRVFYHQVDLLIFSSQQQYYDQVNKKSLFRASKSSSSKGTYLTESDLQFHDDMIRMKMQEEFDQSKLSINKDYQQKLKETEDKAFERAYKKAKQELEQQNTMNVNVCCWCCRMNLYNRIYILNGNRKWEPINVRIWIILISLVLHGIFYCSLSNQLGKKIVIVRSIVFISSTISIDFFLMLILPSSMSSIQPPSQHK